MPTSDLLQPTLFVDTQGLIYAFEARDRLWLDFIDSRLAAGHRLVLAEEHLDEFARSRTLDAALSLTRQAVERRPVWLRSLAELKADEVCRFATGLQDRSAAPRAAVALLEDFRDVSSIGQAEQLGPEEYVRLAAHPTARQDLDRLLRDHAGILDTLTAAAASGQLTKEAREQSVRTSLHRLLALGCGASTAGSSAALALTVRHCFKHLRKLMRQCPAFATEVHLADYRCSNPRRKARESDSRDLTMSAAAFAYVSTFITNDGFLHGGLQYVRARLPWVPSELLHRPPSHGS